MGGGRRDRAYLLLVVCALASALALNVAIPGYAVAAVIAPALHTWLMDRALLAVRDLLIAVQLAAAAPTPTAGRRLPAATARVAAWARPLGRPAGAAR